MGQDAVGACNSNPARDCALLTHQLTGFELYQLTAAYPAADALQLPGLANLNPIGPSDAGGNKNK
jgi:hypothetical protein